MVIPSFRWAAILPLAVSLLVGCTGSTTGVELGEAVALRMQADSVHFQAVRESRVLSAVTRDRDGRTVAEHGFEWTSRDTSVVTVDQDGRLTARARGRTVVVARSGPLSDSVQVVVAPRGVITLTFDDGWKTVSTRAFPLLARHGLKANVAVNHGTVTWPGFLSVAELRALHQAGWSVVSHTVDHARLPTLGDAELERQLVESRDWIRAQGFRGSNVFIVPYHDWGPREAAAVRRHYQAARGHSVSQSVQDSIVAWRPGDAFGLTGLEAELTPMTTEAGRQQIRRYLDRAIAEGRFVDLFFHDIRDDLLPGFEALVELLAEYRPWIHTYHELFPEPAR